MKFSKPAVVLIGAIFASAILIVTGATVDHETVTPQFSKAISNIPGKTLTSAVVTFPPGVKALPHRHGDAFVYAYVLSGTIRSQLDDAPAKVYRAGEDWFEAPGAHHKLTENVSNTEPAKLLAIFVADSGTSLKTLD
jgi:quercetin dioxygenase-like cupin family protein